MKYAEIMREAKLADPSELTRIARQVRTKLAADYEDEPYWTLSQCLGASEMLVSALQAAGISAQRVGGYYTCCDEDYPDLVAQHTPAQEFEPDLTNWDGRWKHWWVTVDDLIIDITADQFHQSDPKNYEVVITRKNDPCYKAFRPGRKRT